MQLVSLSMINSINNLFESSRYTIFNFVKLFPLDPKVLIYVIILSDTHCVIVLPIY